MNGGVSSCFERRRRSALGCSTNLKFFKFGRRLTISKYNHAIKKARLFFKNMIENSALNLVNEMEISKSLGNKRNVFSS